MNGWLLGAGALLILLTVLDALWTTLWVDGHAGPINDRFVRALRATAVGLIPHSSHRLLSLIGPLVLAAAVLLWAVLLWTGWTLLFSADRTALVHANTGTVADLSDRIYFVGYTIFTLGNGDFAPQGDWWQLATAFASMSGLFLVTLTITYLLTLLQAVVQKRSFSSAVHAIGSTGEDIVLRFWDGRGFPGAELQLLALTQQLNLISEQHTAYPMLHYYQEASSRQSLSRAIAAFDDALSIFEAAVQAEARPAAGMLAPARASVRALLETARGAHRDSEAPPPLELGRIREAGVPTHDDAAVASALAAQDEHRRLVRGFLDSEQREWPRPDL